MFLHDQDPERKSKTNTDRTSDALRIQGARTRVSSGRGSTAFRPGFWTSDPSIESAILGQLSKARGSYFEVARIEAFGEAAVDRRQQVAGVGAPALIAPEAGETCGGAQLPKPGLLLSSHGQGVAERGFGFRGITGRTRKQRLGPEAMQIRFKPPLLRLGLQLECKCLLARPKERGPG